MEWLFSLVLALILGITAIYLGFSAFKFLNSHVDEEFELRNNNIAVALVSASFIVSLGILMKSVIDPITQTLFNLAHKYEQLGGEHFRGVINIWNNLSSVHNNLAAVDGNVDPGNATLHETQ